MIWTFAEYFISGVWWASTKVIGIVYKIETNEEIILREVREEKNIIEELKKEIKQERVEIRELKSMLKDSTLKN
jgi:hypothetical protein